jgi:hypothetical protein
LLILSACATPPQKFSEFHEGTWQGKVLIKDKREGHNAIVNMTAKAVDGEHLRLDIMSPTGTHLGSLLIAGGDLQYLNVSERTVFTAKSDRSALQSVLRVPLEATVLYNVFFDHAPNDSRWVCSNDGNGFLKSCKDQKTGVVINWVHRERDQRTIEIDHTSANLQMSIFAFDPHVADKDKAFVLKVPSSFKVKKL